MWKSRRRGRFWKSKGADSARAAGFEPEGPGKRSVSVRLEKGSGCGSSTSVLLLEELIVANKQTVITSLVL